MSPIDAEPVPEVVLWGDDATTGVLSSLMQTLSGRVTPLAVGGPSESVGRTLASELGCPYGDDLRKLLVDYPPAYLLLGTMRGVGPPELAAAAEQQSLILTLEPPAGDLHELDRLLARRDRGGAGVQTYARIAFAPAFVHSPGYIHAAEPLDAIGRRRLITFESVGTKGAGTLYARLMDAWQSVLQFTDMPDSIDASLVGPAEQVPETLRQMAGGIAAHARLPGGGAASVQIADRGGRTRRALHVLGTDAQLRAWDSGYELWQVTGLPIDQAEENQPLTFVDLIARQWLWLIQRAATPPEPNPAADRRALACCLACLLSARTAQPEEPQKMLEMAG